MTPEITEKQTLEWVLEDIFSDRKGIDIDADDDAAKQYAMRDAKAAYDALTTPRDKMSILGILKTVDADVDVADAELKVEDLAWAAYAKWVTSLEYELDEVDLNKRQFCIVHDSLSDLRKVEL